MGGLATELEEVIPLCVEELPHLLCAPSTPLAQRGAGPACHIAGFDRVRVLRDVCCAWRRAVRLGEPSMCFLQEISALDLFRVAGQDSGGGTVCSCADSGKAAQVQGWPQGTTAAPRETTADRKRRDCAIRCRVRGEVAFRQGEEHWLNAFLTVSSLSLLSSTSPASLGHVPNRLPLTQIGHIHVCICSPNVDVFTIYHRRVCGQASRTMSKADTKESCTHSRAFTALYIICARTPPAHTGHQSSSPWAEGGNRRGCVLCDRAQESLSLWCG